VQQQTRIRERRRTKQIWISGANRSTGLQEPAQRRTSSLLAHTLSPDAIISTVGACSAPPRPGLVVRSCASERTQQWVNYAGSHHHLTAVVVNDGERTQTTNENKDRKKRREEEREREREREWQLARARCISIAVRITGTRHKGVRHSESIVFIICTARTHTHTKVSKGKENAINERERWREKEKE
jgi:hypothetical protein